MLRFGRTRFIALFSTLLVALTLVSTDFAEARRGGSFGSRGMRTWQAPAPTRTAPNPPGPVERSIRPLPTRPRASSRRSASSALACSAASAARWCAAF